MLKQIKHSVRAFFIFITVAAQSQMQEINPFQATLPSEIAAEQINLMLSDASGLIWFGTKNGLYRWDGQRVRKFAPPSDTLSDNVTALAFDNQGNIWAGCDDGTIAFANNSQVQMTKKEGFTDSAAISDLFFDHDNNLWFGTRGSGIYCAVNDKVLHLTSENDLNDDYIYDLEPGPKNEIWAATDRGIAICSLNESEDTISVKQIIEGLPDIIVRVLKKDKNNRFWLGLEEGGVCFYKDGKIEMINQSSFTPVQFGQINTIQFDNNNVWIADNRNGVMRIMQDNPEQISLLRLNGIPANEKIKSILHDKLGNLWILTPKKLYVSNGGAFSVIRQIGNLHLDNLHAIIASGPNHFWVANDEGLVEIDNEKHRVFLQHVLNKTVKITSLAQDEKGRIWVATFGQGIICFNPETGVYNFINEKMGLVNDNVLNISCKGNTVWAATLGGASMITLNESGEKLKYDITSYNKENGLGNNYIYNILQDNRGNVWFGTDGIGLVKYAGNQFRIYDEQSGIGDDVVYTIAEDENDDIWFATANSGLYSFNGENFINYRIKDGLSSENIFSVICRNKHVFILSDNGLDVFHKDKHTFINLNEELGLDEVQSEMNSVSAYEDRIYFATQNGIITLSSSAFNDNTYEPITVLDLITVNLKPIKMKPASTFNANENYFVFNYSGLWYQAPQRVQYQVQLKGYDPEWKTTYDHMASYSNLPPGEYTFEVSSFLGSPENQSSTATYSFSIDKPFYQSIWFIILVFALILFLIYLVVKSREKRFRLIEARKKEKLEFEFQTLKNQVNPHFLFNSFSTLISIIEENPKQAILYTEALSDFFREILEVKDLETIPLKDEIRMIGNYYQIQKQRFGEQFSLKIELDDEALLTKIPPLTLQLLTENAVKHNAISKSKPLNVLIRNDKVSIIVENNRNFKKTFEKSTGIGLQNIRDRYKMISGKEIRIVENEELYKVILPIIS